MNLFVPRIPAEENILINLANEQDMYTSGDHVAGYVLIRDRHWHQMHVEVFLICEEHAELDPTQADAPGFDNRRIYIAGESVDGDLEAVDQMQCGAFPFDLRLADDPRASFLLPSFEAPCPELVNAIRWFVEVRVIFKGRQTAAKHEIVVMPAHTLSTSAQLKVSRGETKMVAYDDESEKPSEKSKLTDVHPLLLPGWGCDLSAASSYENGGLKPVQVNICGILHLPDQGLTQSPEYIPMSLVLLVSKPLAVVLVSLNVELVTDISAHLHGQTSRFRIVEKLASPLTSEIHPSNEIMDLSSYVSSCRIESACPGFRAKWLKMEHFLQVALTFESVHNRNSQSTLTLSSSVRVLSPHISEREVDAPPQYTPPSSSSSLASSPSRPVNDLISHPSLPIEHRLGLGQTG